MYFVHGLFYIIQVLFHPAFNFPEKMKFVKDILIITSVTLILLLLTECILRISGTGFSPKFFIEKELKGRKVLINNVDYTIPFFSERLVRTPMPIVMDKVKDKNTCRIFIAGESAVMGDPDYSYGVGRILEVILKEQFPGKHFEIINTAITAINSNVILPIVKESAKHEPDLFIFYIGNNEVIGPYGPTSVFLPFLRNPYLIRSSIAINSTRIGQLTRWLGQKLGKSGGVPAKWEGMEMYLKHQLAWDDPRLEGVYNIYQDNLRDMCKAVERSNAPVILCTVASNLRDCAPFGSAHRQTKSNLNCTGDAQLCFEKGNVFLAAGDIEKAYAYFSMARDYDLLRFRTDSRINDITRKVQGEFDSSRVHLLDFEKAIRSSAENGIPGYDLFYEHVHFNFKGNYVLAVTLAEAVKKALKIATTIPAPALDLCKKRLAFNGYEESKVHDDVMLRFSKAPFIQQFTHARDIKRLNEINRSFENSLRNIDETDSSYIKALQDQDDWLIRYNYALFQIKNFPERRKKIIQTLTELKDEVPQLASLYFNLGYAYQLDENYFSARDNYAQALKILPGYSQVYEEMGKISIVENNYKDAGDYFEKARISNIQIAEIYARMALRYAQLKQADKANELMMACLEYNPKNFEALISLGGYNLARKNYQMAENYFRKCVEVNPNHAESYYYLGKSFEGNRQFREAKDSYQKCIDLKPDNKRYHNSIGKVLFLLRLYAEAGKAFSRTIELDPEFFEAYVNLADCYMAQNLPGEARKTLKKLVPRNINDPVILNRLSLEFSRLNDMRSSAECSELARQNAHR